MGTNVNENNIVNTDVANSDVAEVLENELKGVDDVKDLGYKPLTLSNWFFTFMCMNIPVIGLFYLLIMSFSKSQPLKRDFARAYLIYQIIFLTISVVLVFIFCYFGLEIADNALKFMQEL